MTEDEFWKLIEASKRGTGGEVNEQMVKLEEKLARLPPEEIQAFDTLYNVFRQKAYRWDLWAAAYIINGGCSDDGFEYFRGWLIAKGRKAYENALDNPESLARIAEPDSECEDILYVADRAYEGVVGTPMIRKPCKAPKIQGKKWKEDDLPALYPKLWKKFSAEEDDA